MSENGSFIYFRIAIAIAIDYLNDHSDFINITWCADDVLSVADERGLELSQDQCLEVLDYLENNHDANYGISQYCSVNN